MTQAERLLLPDVGDLAGFEQHILERFELRLLVARHQGVAQLVAMVEVVLNCRLSAPGNEDELLDAGRACLLDRILNERFIDDWQHLLGQSLGDRQEPGAEATDRKDRLARSLRHV